ncbi:hypothetical protein V492_05135 [Pseudogymnoascus sp. VKM F-4246]|nr:hypothetical protein V492_05135 [Pseudogymnoascus sp. VKM F-4246]
MESQARKKFAKPPVKLACLSCVWTGGKSANILEVEGVGPVFPSIVAAQRAGHGNLLSRYLSRSHFYQLKSVANLDITGAGLRQLDLFTGDDAVFPDAQIDEELQFYDTVQLDQGFDLLDMQLDSTLDDSGRSAWDGFNSAPLTSGSDENLSDVRAYKTDADMLDAYYVYCHAYFPILPPPIQLPVDRPVALGSLTGHNGPSTPLSLALSAVLALVPLHDDPDPKGEKSTWNRRIQAHKFAQASFGALDNESELLDSRINPRDALSNANPGAHRAPFHRDLPLDLEASIAYILLSVYEYGQRGNVKKMLNRSGQALVLALDSKLYSPIEDQFVEARRRVWWAVYTNVCDAAIISNTDAAIDIRDPKFTASYPTIAADPEAFQFFIQCQQAILDASNYSNDLNAIVKSGGDPSVLHMRTLEIESRLESLEQIADAWFDKTLSNLPVASSEAVVAKTLRSIGRIKINSSRIKLHRYYAFMNTPIFSKVHCGLPVKPTNTSTLTSNGLYNILAHDPSSQLQPGQPGSGLSRIDTRGLPISIPSPIMDSNLSSTVSYSANIAHKAALAIADSMHAIPYPNPSGHVDKSGFLSTPLSSLPPRSMPSFMCCAVMGAYVLAMLTYKLRDAQLETSNPDICLALSAYEDALRHGLGHILTGLENYAIAFEAIDGMREEVAMAFRVSLAESQSDPNNRVRWNAYYSGSN